MKKVLALAIFLMISARAYADGPTRESLYSDINLVCRSLDLRISWLLRAIDSDSARKSEGAICLYLGQVLGKVEAMNTLIAKAVHKTVLGNFEYLLDPEDYQLINEDIRQPIRFKNENRILTGRLSDLCETGAPTMSAENLKLLKSKINDLEARIKLLSAKSEKEMLRSSYQFNK